MLVLLLALLALPALHTAPSEAQGEEAMNALNAIPILGWVIAALVCLFVAVPVYLLWNWLAPIYFYWLPPVYLRIPFWHTFGLLWLLSSLRSLLLPSINANAKSEKG